MVNRVILFVMFLTGIFANCSSQNFSGLQGKKLNWAPDLGSVKESFIGRLFGAVEGSIDSVVVTGDSETELQVMIYYKDYVNAYFNISTLNESRKAEQHIESVTFGQSERNSPAECILKLKTESAPVPLNASSYLRIEIAKKANGRGKVKIFNLKKKWATSGGGGEVVPDTASIPVPDSTGGSLPVPVAAGIIIPSGTEVMPLKGSFSISTGALLLRRED